jgi:hypothetical protein
MAYKNIGALLVTEDAKASSKRDYNRYALPLKLQAADDMQTAIDAGASPEKAFTEVFAASREMHKIARSLGLALDVERGNWIRN